MLLFYDYDVWGVLCLYVEYMESYALNQKIFVAMIIESSMNWKF